MIQILFIGAGGFLGAIGRFLISRFMGNFISSFPLGTLVVNIAGSFVLGLILYSVSFGKDISPNMRDFLTIGFLGSFTTMSTFAFESFRFAELSQVALLLLNLLLNVVLCFIAIYLGKELALIISK